MSERVESTDVNFPDLNPNSYDYVNKMKLDLDVSPRSVNFSANNRAFRFSLQIKVITSFFQVFRLVFFQRNLPGHLWKLIFLHVN